MQTPLEGFKVLLVEDDLLTLELFEFAVKESGAEVLSCSSASQALKGIESWVPDVIVSDIGLPDDDGVSLIQEFRRRPETAGVPAIALTGFTSKENRENLLRAGFQHVLGKPVDPFALIDCVREVCARENRF